MFLSSRIHLITIKLIINLYSNCLLITLIRVFTLMCYIVLYTSTNLTDPLIQVTNRYTHNRITSSVQALCTYFCKSSDPFKNIIIIAGVTILKQFYTSISL